MKYKTYTDPKLEKEWNLDDAICLVNTGETNMNNCPVKKKIRRISKNCLGCAFLMRTKKRSGSTGKENKK